jgi:hypothetical protein
MSSKVPRARFPIGDGRCAVLGAHPCRACASCHRRRHGLGCSHFGNHSLGARPTSVTPRAHHPALAPWATTPAPRHTWGRRPAQYQSGRPMPAAPGLPELPGSPPGRAASGTSDTEWCWGLSRSATLDLAARTGADVGGCCHGYPSLGWSVVRVSPVVGFHAVVAVIPTWPHLGASAFVAQRGRRNEAGRLLSGRRFTRRPWRFRSPPRGRQCGALRSAGIARGSVWCDRDTALRTGPRRRGAAQQRYELLLARTQFLA